MSKFVSQGEREAIARNGIIDGVNYSQVFAICFVCGTTAPGMHPEGWAEWSRTNTELPYFLSSCPEHSTHEGIWDALPASKNTIDRIKRLTLALQFYADPDSYFATAIWTDPPCGDFYLDYGIHGHPEYQKEDVRPGHLARVALGQESLYWFPQEPITPAEYKEGHEPLPVERLDE